jgi:chloride intracellular channel protein 2
MMMTNHQNHQANGVILYVKAGADGQRYGACPFCQRVFMVLLLKSLHGPRSAKLNFRVVTVNLARPPEEFRRRGLRRLPALVDDVHGDQEVLDTVEDIISYIDAKYPDGGLLSYDSPAADLAVKDVFSRFCFYIKEVCKDPAQLEGELRRLDAFLAKQTAKFLCGNTLCHLDCELLPKLQHIRVASARLKGFQISTSLHNVWRYLHAAYSEDVFVKTCPSDQEILLHWLDRPEMGKMAYEEHKRLANETPRYSLDVPAFAALVTIE